MADTFQFDVFLSHSAKDRAVVRELAARLQRDGVRVWRDEEQVKPGDRIPAKIEAGLEHSRVPVSRRVANILLLASKRSRLCPHSRKPYE
jgi:hypothetical protein